MDQGWDHTENEDKLLLTHTLGMGTFRDRDMGTVMDSVVYGSDTVTNVSGIGCSNDNTYNLGSGGDELTSLTSEYRNQLLTIVLNKVNRMHIFLYNLIPTNLSYFCNIVSNILNSIFQSLKLVASTKDILCDIHSVIISSPGIIIVQFKLCLNNTTSKLKDLHKEMLNLSDSYGYINHLKNQLQTIIDCTKDTNNLNSKLSQIIEKFKCSLLEFNKIESCIKCVKSKIQPITILKNQLLTLSIIISTKYLDSFYFKIKCCCDNIDRISLLICDVKFYTCRLKYWIRKFINLDISNNLLNRFLFTDKIIETDFDGICSNMKSLYCCICKISNICNSEPQCKCSCSCNSICKRNFICLCLCEFKPEKASVCCICICKKDKSGCKCICICVCDKTGGQCCCQSREHNCKKSLVKVDLSRLRNDTLRILCHLRFIRCYIQIINKKCCYCSCCINGRCDGSCCEPCQSITDYYKSIMSRIHWIELLFKEVSTEILKLRTLKNILSPISLIATKCEKCPGDCYKDINSLVENIERALNYYTLFGYRIEDIRSFVYYKLNYNRSKEIISSLEKSINPLLKNLKLINSQIQTNVYHTKMLEQFIMSVMSRTVIDESSFIISRLYVYYKTKDLIDETLQILNRCICVRIYNRDWRDKIETFDRPLPNVNTRYYSPTIISLMMTHILNDGNYMCLCLVVRYILLNDLYALIRYNEHLYMDMLSYMSRSYKKYSYSMTHNFNSSKLIMLIITTLDKIIRWMNNIYIGEKIHCYCYDINNSYYPYLISIILYVSSMVENIWSMDTETIRMTIECVSSLLVEYQSIHVFTHYYSPSRHSMLLNIISGLTKGKLIHTNVSHSAGVVPENTKSPLMFNSRLSLMSTVTQKEDKRTIYGTISDKRMGLFKDSLKCGFMSFRSMILATQFSKDKLTLIYNKFSCLCYSCQSNFKDGKLDLTNMYANIPLKYLEKICKEECEKTCCQKNSQCNICPIAKIRMRCLSISFKDMGLIIGNVSGDVLLNYLMGSVSISEDFITNLCVGFGEVYTIMLKNLLTSNDWFLRNYGNTGITNVETRNWGYDTRYEHDVGTDKGFGKGDGYPNLIDSRYTFSHLPIFP